jgi:hypothetical protein
VLSTEIPDRDWGIAVAWVFLATLSSVQIPGPLAHQVLPIDKTGRVLPVDPPRDILGSHRQEATPVRQDIFPVRAQVLNRHRLFIRPPELRHL